MNALLKKINYNRYPGTKNSIMPGNSTLLPPIYCPNYLTFGKNYVRHRYYSETI